MNIKDLKSYEILSHRTIKDINSDSFILTHKKTGAKIALISNDDDNKVFCAGFRTPPKDSTGVPHILEHSVLCGSADFPIKDPFVELVKGSLNTFLNAMTYTDKTIYPVASCNDLDFQNLMHVYLDAVFYPNIYKQPMIFKQEGWHYEMEDENDDLHINGVVYNEMKGAFSSPDDVLERELITSLYPDTPYGFESGGDPDDIPSLTYEEFLNFHKKYYHPSNCYIYLYGNMDMAEKLAYIDEKYLSHFERLPIESEIKAQTPFTQMARIEKEYPISEEEEIKQNTYLAYNTAVGDSLDRELYVAFQIIDYAICSAPGAPLKQALIEKGIGTDVYSTYDNGVQQPYFSIVAKNADKEQEAEFLHTIKEVLASIAAGGFDKKSLAAGINYYEFKYREADYGSYPKGLVYGMQMFDSWLYDDTKPFLHIEANETFAAMRKYAESDYFENLIQTYLINNTHTSLVVLVPKKGLTEERESALGQKLSAFKETLSKEQISAIVADTKALTEYQETPNTKEDLAAIPLLTREDMKKEAPGFVNEVRKTGDTTILYHPLYTNGIGYLRLIFRLDSIPEELFPYVGILKGTLGLLDTKHYKYGDLFNEINIITGGMAAVNNAYGNVADQTACTVTMELKAKVLYQNLDKAIELMKEIMLTSRFEDKKRVGEILAEGKSRMQGQMMSAGHSVAVNRALSYVSLPSAVNEALSGMDFYRLLSELDENYQQEAEALSVILHKLSESIFRAENLLVDFTGEEEGYAPLPAYLEALKEELYTTDVQKGSYTPKLVKENDGYKTPGQVQYVCRAGNFKTKGMAYHGSLKVLKVMMGYDYLWNQVRVKGGAYGCMCGFGKSGDCFFVSYRDPNLKKTIEIYEKAADYMAQFEADERTLTQYIIGAVSELDTPMNPAAKGLFSLSGYMTGLTDEDLQRERDELIGTTAEDLKRTASFIRAFLSDECLCVVGNAGQIQKAENLFGKIENLL